MLNITPEIAAQTLLERQDQRRSLKAWCVHNGDIPAKHHELIIREIELVVKNLFRALVRGYEVPDEKLKLMVMMPPGTAKSTYISKNTPPWILGQWQYLKKELEAAGRPVVPLEVLATSHTSDFANRWGKAARNLIHGNEIWLGYDLAKDSTAMDEWALTNRCAYKAAGVGKGISGIRFHVGLIDDFCGLESDAHSKLFNDSTYTWYTSDFKKRSQPIAAQILIFNHRDEDDLGGRLMAEEASEWRIIRLPLLVETEEQAEVDPLGRSVGEWIWPEYFTEKQVRDRMRDPGASGIEQQDPCPLKGNLFEVEWFADEFTYNSLSILEGGQVYGASDHAVSEAQTADNTCLGLGVYKNGLLYIHPDLAWDRMGLKRQVAEWIRLGKTYKPIRWRAEKGQISKSLYPFLQDQMSLENAYFSVYQVTPARDKVTRAQSFLGLCSSKRVRWPSTNLAPWMGRAKKEMLGFPNAKHDDFVDFVAHLGMEVNRMFSTESKPKEEQPVDYNKPGWAITLPQIKAQKKFADRTRWQLTHR